MSVSAALSPMLAVIRARTLSWAAIAVGILVGYYVLQLAAVSFGLWQLPNYFVWYDYIGNVQRIFAGTPSSSDALKIMQDEWLIETGHKSYAYGNGVALWSLNVQPMRILQILMAGGLIAACALMLRSGRQTMISRQRAVRFSCVALAGLGAAMVAVGNATLSWVVACLSPSWIATLHMIGLDANVVDSIEPYGAAVTFIGFVFLTAGSVGVSASLSDAAHIGHRFSKHAAQG